MREMLDYSQHSVVFVGIVYMVAWRCGRMANFRVNWGSKCLNDKINSQIASQIKYFF